ncbi:MAG: NAD-dependent epimerase/dehydratase family protein [Candidatus Aminicenantes bacterium]|nr:NAD-dependent epimerase/dehydratase family protein [Candidatus Aminicenantes bacterium]
MSQRSRGAAILGGSGFIGHAVTEELVRCGYRVSVVNRGLTPAAFAGPVERVKADRTDPLSFAQALAAIDADCVVDVTAFREEETRAAIEAFRGRIERFVHIGSLSVYQWPFPCPVAEDWPLETDPFVSYGFHKAGCERALQAEPVAGLPWSILRLPAVCGPRDPTSREADLRRQICGGQPVYVPPRPYFCQNLFVQDAARAVRMMIETPAAAGRAYNVGGPPFTLEEYAGLLADLLGKPPRLVRASGRALAEGGIDPHKIPYYFEGDLCLDTRRIRDELAFTPAFDREQALSLTLDWLARAEGADAAE